MLSVSEVRLEALRWVAPKGPGHPRGKPVRVRIRAGVRGRG